MKKVKVFFANHAQFEGKYTNLGDWAIFEEMVQALEGLIDNGQLEIIVPSADPSFTNANYKVTAFKRGGFEGIRNTYKWIKKSDIVLVGGGELIQDMSSLVYTPYQLIRPLLGKIFHKKLFAYAIGIGEEKEIKPISRFLSHTVLNMFDVITVRDLKSGKVLKDYLKVNKPLIYVTADPAVNLSTVKTEVPDTKFAVISARSVYHRNGNLLPFTIRKKLHLVPKSYYRAIDEFEKEIAILADKIIDELGMKVLFLNTYTGKEMSAGDDKFTSSIIRKMKNKKSVSVISKDLYPGQTKYVLSKADFVVSVPLHPLILGASEKTPVFSLAYASKNRCFMEQTGLPYIYKVENTGDRISSGKIFNDIISFINNREEIEKFNSKIDVIREKEKKNYELLREMIASETQK